MRVFLDACVLYPPLVRTLTLKAAQAGLFAPLWSARVLDEWRLAVARKQGPGEVAAAEAETVRMAVAFPTALVPGNADLEAQFALPDPNDTHVLAAAVVAEADTLLTFNLGDFPKRTLAGVAIEARHPDGFFWTLWSEAPGAMGDIVDTALPGEDAETVRRALKRARLSRFAKALAAPDH